MAKMKEVLVRIKQYFTKLENDKVNKAESSTENNIVLFDENGNVKDSGKSINDVGKVASVSVGGGTPIQPDQNKNINLPAYPTAESLGVNLRALITETGNKIDLEINNTNFKMVAKLYDKNNNLLSTSSEIDLPLESVVVGGSYEPITKQVVLTLQNGTTIAFSVADLIYGLQSEITANNPLSSDLVSDTGNAHKFVTENEKAQITTNQNDIAGIKNGTSIDSFADVESALTNKADKSTTYTKTEVNNLLDDKADTSAIPTKTSDLTNDSGFLTQHQDISGKEDKSNKVNAFQTTPDNTHYPSEKLVKDNLDLKADKSTTYTKTETNTALNNKVDKVEGKGLSTNDYTTAEKNKLAGLSNYDDTVVRGLITAEANRAIKQENKALYFKGAFDSADGKTRQTGVIDLGTLDYASNDDTYPTNSFYSTTLLTNAKGSENAKVSINAETCFINANGNLIIIVNQEYASASAFKQAMQGVLLQYKLATSYTEQVIEGESILPLDSNMAQMIRQDVVEGLNLFDVSTTNFSTTDNWNIVTDFYLEAGKTYTVWTNESNYDLHITGVSSWQGVDNSYATFTPTSSGYLNFGSSNYNWWSHLSAFKQLKIMVVLGNGKYPYEPYHANKHITDDEATLLKKEEEKCRNLLPNSKGISGSSQTVLTEVVNLPIGTYTIQASGGTYSGAMAINVLYADGTSGGNIVAGNVGTALTFTTTKAITQFSIYCNSTISNVNFMLNEGSEPQPYQEWYGEIVHEKQLQEAIANAITTALNTAV